MAWDAGLFVAGLDAGLVTLLRIDHLLALVSTSLTVPSSVCGSPRRNDFSLLMLAGLPGFYHTNHDCNETSVPCSLSSTMCGWLDWLQSRLTSFSL